MDVRKFTAPTVGEALNNIKHELGEDAIILRTRNVKRGGVLSFLSREMVEVTAAAADRSLPPDREVASRSSEVERLLRTRAAIDNSSEIKEQLGELKEHIRMLAEQIRIERMPSLPPVLSSHLKDLVRNGVESRLACELTQHLNILYPGDALEKSEFTNAELRSAIAGMIKIRRPPLKSPNRARIVAIIGPTGVGKTTTLAKLVTSFRFWGRLNCALVSADTYRVAALEQLKTFAAIAGLPMESVYQPGAMKTALARHHQRDAIFIDTAGRSQTDPEKIIELAEFLVAAEPDEVLLCLNTSTRIEDQLDIIEHYSPLTPSGIIFTKLDETRTPGSILNILTQTSLPATFITCGQNVPDDIFMTEPRRLAEIILNPMKMTELLKSRFASWTTESSNNGAAV